MQPVQGVECSGLKSPGLGYLQVSRFYILTLQLYFALVEEENFSRIPNFSCKEPPLHMSKARPFIMSHSNQAYNGYWGAENRSNLRHAMTGSVCTHGCPAVSETLQSSWPQLCSTSSLCRSTLPGWSVQAFSLSSVMGKQTKPLNLQHRECPLSGHCLPLQYNTH